MKFCRRYWVFIGTAVSCATVASLSTLYLASVQEPFRECNSVAAACFTAIGMVPCMVPGILLLIPVMVAIPYMLGQNEKPGLISYLILGCITAYTALDAVNNLSAILGYHDIYLFAHTIIGTANNVSGTVAGTGESLC